MKNSKLNKMKKLFKQFGFLFSIRYCFYKTLKLDDKYIQLIYAYLEKDNEKIINKYNNIKLTHTNKTPIKNNDKVPVWVCWWQGYDKMPELCKMFYNRLKKVLPSNTKLILITLDNYLDYAIIPNVITKKFEEGNISMTTYSDILRNYLLRDNGGLWIDSSVFVSNKIPNEFFESTEWWSVNLFSENANISNLGQKISERKWSGFLQKGEKDNILNSYLCDSFLNFYEKHDCLIDYFIQNLYIKIGYDNIKQIKLIIDAIPYNNQNVYSLYDNIDDEFDETKYKEWNNNTLFYKLTQKREYDSYNSNNKLTYYGYIEKICNDKKGFLDEKK